MDKGLMDMELMAMEPMDMGMTTYHKTMVNLLITSVEGSMMH